MSSELITHTSDASFNADVIEAGTPVLVDYWAEWCGPCKMIAPILDEVSKDYDGKLRIAKMNVDENRDIPAKFGIRGIPTLMLFKDGQLAATKVGALSAVDRLYRQSPIISARRPARRAAWRDTARPGTWPGRPVRLPASRKALSPRLPDLPFVPVRPPRPPPRLPRRGCPQPPTRTPPHAPPAALTSPSSSRWAKRWRSESPAGKQERCSRSLTLKTASRFGAASSGPPDGPASCARPRQLHGLTDDIYLSPSQVRRFNLHRHGRGRGPGAQGRRAPRAGEGRQDQRLSLRRASTDHVRG
jgi:thioredoxin 1